MSSTEPIIHSNLEGSHSPLTTACSAPIRRLINLLDRLDQRINALSVYSDIQQSAVSPPSLPLDSSWSGFGGHSNPFYSHKGLQLTGLPPSSSSTVQEAIDHLYQSLLRRQLAYPQWTQNASNSESEVQATGPDSRKYNQILIVLDDVWDIEIGKVLSSLPATFLVTSRNENILRTVNSLTKSFL
ncbi:unnamed protein product [Protopolystoma xenopodis]|uniref:NB-ARC domain-containing protein n=1 Tax=Protopolystoma xenopodis TaxID=117903 RepID=A0A3S5BLD8_9PLAT|nr:unnamed protein product [Protopolystoma xenopodis]